MEPAGGAGDSYFRPSMQLGGWSWGTASSSIIGGAMAAGQGVPVNRGGAPGFERLGGSGSTQGVVPRNPYGGGANSPRRQELLHIRAQQELVGRGFNPGTGGVGAEVLTFGGWDAPPIEPSLALPQLRVVPFPLLPEGATQQQQTVLGQAALAVASTAMPRPPTRPEIRVGIGSEWGWTSYRNQLLAEGRSKTGSCTNFHLLPHPLRPHGGGGGDLGSLLLAVASSAPGSDGVAAASGFLTPVLAALAR